MAVMQISWQIYTQGRTTRRTLLLEDFMKGFKNGWPLPRSNSRLVTWELRQHTAVQTLLWSPWPRSLTRAWELECFHYNSSLGISLARVGKVAVPERAVGKQGIHGRISSLTIRNAHFLSEFWITHNDFSILSEAKGVQNKSERPAGKEWATCSAWKPCPAIPTAFEVQFL